MDVCKYKIASISVFEIMILFHMCLKWAMVFITEAKAEATKCTAFCQMTQFKDLE